MFTLKKLWIASLVALVAAVAAGLSSPAMAGESVFIEGIEGGHDTGQHESLLYVWTRDADSRETDALAVVDVDPESETWGEILYMAPTGSGANEAHHFGYTRSADRIFAGGLKSNRLFIYDLGQNPRRPQLLRIVDLDATGYSGPHSFYAVPGGVMITMLGAADGGGPGGLIMLDNDGKLVAAWPQAGHPGAPRYMYDVGVKPAMNRMITSSFAHTHNANMHGGPPPKLVGDKVVIWDWKAKKILRVVKLDPAPLVVRWLHGADERGGYVNCVYGNSVWYWEDDDGDGKLRFHRVIDTGKGSAPADMRISYDNRYLYVTLFAGSKVLQYDISEPMEPRLVDSVELPHPNMIRLSPDSERLYVTNSLLSGMDPDRNFHAWLLHVGPDGMEVDEEFAPDFMGYSPNGPMGPHDMLLK
ncbi:MAG: selenium-binding family protein [Gammaproteobacteria bacterium]|nr:selenium-binding family protein [Gammaproteobacteria bacterium]